MMTGRTSQWSFCAGPCAVNTNEGENSGYKIGLPNIGCIHLDTQGHGIGVNPDTLHAWMALFMA